MNVKSENSGPIAQTSVIQRFDALDGLRGLAALVVVIGHFWPFQDFKSLPIINIFMDTKLPVAIFFVLSGVVLSHSARNFQKNTSWLAFVLISRYVRLLIPILAITLLVTVLYLSGFILVDSLPGSYSEWSGYKVFYQFSLEWINALQFSTLDVFFNYNPEKTYIPPSWTMRPELFASTLLFSFLFLLSFLRLENIPVLLFVPAAIIIFFTKDFLPGVYYFGYFLMGFVIYKVYMVKGVNSKVGFGLLFFVLLIKTMLYFYSIKGLFIDLVFASCIVTVILFSSKVQELLANRVFIWLGKISFPLYLVHVPLYCSLGMFNFIMLDSLGINVSLGWAINFVITLSICLLVAHLLTFVDSGTLKIIRIIKSKFGLSYSPYVQSNYQGQVVK
ncbi:MAG: acyltransferase [Colwellia sp.]|jgi:Predicted acyltransferases